jgi:hypothetical protein
MASSADEYRFTDVGDGLVVDGVRKGDRHSPVGSLLLAGRNEVIVRSVLTSAKALLAGARPLPPGSADNEVEREGRPRGLGDDLAQVG